MVAALNIHNVKSVTVSRTELVRDSGEKFLSTDIVISNESGQKVTVVLFSDNLDLQIEDEG